MSANVLVRDESSLYVSDPDWDLYDNDRITLVFRCQHEDVQNNEDGIYCFNCRNEDLTQDQIEEFTQAYMAGVSSDYDESDEVRNQ